LLALVLALGLATAGCSGDDSPEDDSGATVQERLDAAKTTLDEAESINIDLSTDALPDGTIGLLSATGVGNHDPAFDGDVTVAVAGASQDAEVVSVDGQVQAKLGFAPAYVPVDPARLGAPDPASFFDRETGVSNFLSTTIEPVEGEETRDGEEVLTSISGTLPGDVVKDVVPTADSQGEFDVTYALSDDDVLRSARITGPFYPDAPDVTYDLTAEASDEAVTITAP
jgi:lipoprotein LprG